MWKLAWNTVLLFWYLRYLLSYHHNHCYFKEYVSVQDFKWVINTGCYTIWHIFRVPKCVWSVASIVKTWKRKPLHWVRSLAGSCVYKCVLSRWCTLTLTLTLHNDWGRWVCGLHTLRCDSWGDVSAWVSELPVCLPACLHTPPPPHTHSLHTYTCTTSHRFPSSDTFTPTFFQGYTDSDVMFGL